MEEHQALSLKISLLRTTLKLYKLNRDYHRVDTHRPLTDSSLMELLRPKALLLVVISKHRHRFTQCLSSRCTKVSLQAVYWKLAAMSVRHRRAAVCTSRSFIIMALGTFSLAAVVTYLMFNSQLLVQGGGPTTALPSIDFSKLMSPKPISNLFSGQLNVKKFVTCIAT